MTESASYDIAVSFAEEQRAVADEVVEACRQRGLTVLEGNDLPQAEVRFLVPFVSTADEVRTDDEHVLPVLTGDDPSSSPHLHADGNLVDTLVARVEAAETAGHERVLVADLVAALKQPEPAAEPEPEPAQQNNPLRALAEQFAAASPTLAKRLSGSLHLDGTTVAVRVEREDNTVYAVETRDDDTVNFVVLGGTTDQFSTLWQRIEDMLSA
ncbi:hypothetical protein [Lentzea sp. NPDC059081]|uniref:hypothetical protein n=1 Tax=Lentzea sp. NPDC059081 TaxID=3346719 RepID=UPI0036AF9166